MALLHERWKEYTVKEIEKIKNKHCRKCPYSGTVGSKNTDNNICDYLLVTGKRRGCRPEVCEHYKDDVKRIERKQCLY